MEIRTPIYILGRSFFMASRVLWGRGGFDEKRAERREGRLTSDSIAQQQQKLTIALRLYGTSGH